MMQYEYPAANIHCHGLDRSLHDPIAMQRPQVLIVFRSLGCVLGNLLFL